MTPRPSNAARPDELGVTQLALALDVVCDAPTVRECADLMRELREIALGDVWQSGEYRVERDDVTGCDTVRFLRGSHVRGEWVCDTTNRLAAALRAIRDELVGTGITTGWLRRGALALEQESDDCPRELVYNHINVNEFMQESLLSALPARIIDNLNDVTPTFISISGHVRVDQQPYVDAIVVGSKHVSRDLDTHAARKVLDPFGYLELKYEQVRNPHFYDFRRMCSCKSHRGNRWLPEFEFSGGDVYCKWCRAEMTHQRRMASAAQPGAPAKRKYQSRTLARPRTYNRRTSSMAG